MLIPGPLSLSSPCLTACIPFPQPRVYRSYRHEDGEEPEPPYTTKAIEKSVLLLLYFVFNFDENLKRVANEHPFNCHDGGSKSQPSIKKQKRIPFLPPYIINLPHTRCAHLVPAHKPVSVKPRAETNTGSVAQHV